jgi:hypothetical protein
VVRDHDDEQPGVMIEHARRLTRIVSSRIKYVQAENCLRNRGER